MSDHDALLAAICAEPDEDTPRLVFADWLEENDQPDRAAFVRAQVELARTPAWEPFAAFCRWRRREWFTGRPFRHSLPPLPPSVEWHDQAFARGLGWRLNVRSLLAWEQVSAGVLARAPVGEMHLWGAPMLEQWQAFAASPVVSRLRKVHLMANPIEPLRVLRDAPAALGITDLHFARATGAGMPFVVEELFESPLGRVVRGVHFHMGWHESLEDLIDALHTGPELERLSYSTMALTEVLVERLMRGPAVRGLAELDLTGNPLGSAGLRNVLRELPPGVHTLGLTATGAGGGGFDLFASSPALTGLRRLDLSRNPLTPRAVRVLSRSQYLAGLRSLNLSKCRVGERELRHLTRAKFWRNLVELDLRDNPIPAAGVRHLLDAAIPDDLAALVLGGDQLGTQARDELRMRYGERVVFARSEPGM